MNLHFTQQDLICVLMYALSFCIAVMCERSRASQGDGE